MKDIKRLVLRSSLSLAFSLIQEGSRQVARGCCEETESTACVYTIPVVLRVGCKVEEIRDGTGSQTAVMVAWHRG